MTIDEKEYLHQYHNGFIEFKKSDRKKITKKTQMQMDAILEYMEEGKRYKAGEFVDVLGVKETRTKGKSYRKC